MIAKTQILVKYNEIYNQYSDRCIDDYEVFIRSRVVEYFLNTSQIVSDELMQLIDDALLNKCLLYHLKFRKICDDLGDPETVNTADGSLSMKKNSDFNYKNK